MNITKLYTIRDAKADYYIPPFAQRNNGEAIRAFQDTCSKPGTTIHDHPEDFFLFLIGEFDQELGVIKPLAPVNLACGLDFKKAE